MVLQDNGNRAFLDLSHVIEIVLFEDLLKLVVHRQVVKLLSGKHICLLQCNLLLRLLLDLVLFFLSLALLGTSKLLFFYRLLCFDNGGDLNCLLHLCWLVGWLLYLCRSLHLWNLLYFNWLLSLRLLLYIYWVLHLNLLLHLFSYFDLSQFLGYLYGWERLLVLRDKNSFDLLWSIKMSSCPHYNLSLLLFDLRCLLTLYYWFCTLFFVCLILEPVELLLNDLLLGLLVSVPILLGNRLSLSIYWSNRSLLGSGSETFKVDI